MNVFITQPVGKEKLINAFQLAGAFVLSPPYRFITPNIIIPVVDEELPTLAYLKPLFELQGILVAIASEFTIHMCRDKGQFSSFCRRHSFDIPTTARFPAIVKPRFGKGSKGQFKIDHSYIIQEIIDWPEYSIDYYKDKEVMSIIPRLREQVVNGESKAGTIVMDDRLINEAARLGSELGLEYHNVLQCFYDGTNIKWIEVNPRYGGGSWLTFEKFNSPKRLIELAKEKVA